MSIFLFFTNTFPAAVVIRKVPLKGTIYLVLDVHGLPSCQINANKACDPGKTQTPESLQ